MTHLKLLSRYVISLLLAIASVGAYAQSASVTSGEYMTPPSKDVSFLFGDWVVDGDHSILGPVKRWSIHMSSNGKYSAEIKKDDSSELYVERGVWSAADRDHLLLVRQSINLRPAQATSKSDVELYEILAIYPQSVEFRRMSADGKPMKFMRARL